MSIATTISLAALAVSLVAVAVALAGAARLRDAVENGKLGTPPSMRAPLPETGADIKPFRADTVAGTPLSNGDLAIDKQLMGFFAIGCAPCKDEVPNFLAAAEALPDGYPAPIAVVTGTPDEAKQFAQSFPADLRVVLEPEPPPDNALSLAAGVRSYPTFLVANHGKIEMSAIRIGHLVALH